MLSDEQISFLVVDEPEAHGSCGFGWQVTYPEWRLMAVRVHSVAQGVDSYRTLQIKSIAFQTVVTELILRFMLPDMAHNKTWWSLHSIGTPDPQHVILASFDRNPNVDETIQKYIKFIIYNSKSPFRFRFDDGSEQTVEFVRSVLSVERCTLRLPKLRNKNRTSDLINEYIIIKMSSNKIIKL